MKNEFMGNTPINDDNEAGDTSHIKKVDLPTIEFGADEASIEQSIVEAIEQLPLDEQEQYWQLMDNDVLEIGVKLNLVNDMLRRYNGDNQE